MTIPVLDELHSSNIVADSRDSKARQWKILHSVASFQFGHLQQPSQLFHASDQHHAQVALATEDAAKALPHSGDFEPSKIDFLKCAEKQEEELLKKYKELISI